MNITLTGTNINELWFKLKNLFIEGAYDYIDDQKTRELFNTQLILTSPCDNLLSDRLRNLSLRYVAGELSFYLSGANSLSFISHYASFWRGISDDNRTVNSAYGYRLFMKNHGHGYSQFHYALKQLIKNRHSRKAIAFVSGPDVAYSDSRDNICTNYLQFFIRDNKLYCIADMRSNDVWLGLPYDLLFFTLVQQIMHISLLHYYPDLNLGNYIHKANSLHVYDRNYKLFTDRNTMNAACLRKYTIDNDLYLPPLCNDDIDCWFKDFLAYESARRTYEEIGCLKSYGFYLSLLETQLLKRTTPFQAKLIKFLINDK